MRILRHIPCLAILLVLYNVLTLIPATAKGFSANISVVQVPLPRAGASVLLTVVFEPMVTTESGSAGSSPICERVWSCLGALSPDLHPTSPAAPSAAVAARKWRRLTPAASPHARFMRSPLNGAAKG